jgi:PAS domain S-box-containing protein
MARPSRTAAGYAALSAMAERETILLVDDDRQVTRVLGEFLEAEGYAVLTAHTAQQALHTLEKTTVSLALLDLVLPDRDGVALMGEIRKLESPPEVVIITGHATVDSAVAAVEAGAAGYILKPFDLSRLGALVGRVLERRRLLGENARLSAELAERLRETELLLVISRMISSTLDVREALRRICRELTRLVGADTAAAYLHDPGRDLLVPTVAYRVPPDHLEALVTLTIPLRAQGFYLPLWRDRRPLQSDDVPRDPRFTHEAFRRIRHQSGLLLPLILDSEVGGAFYLVWWTARRILTDRELALLESVSAQVAVLLRNARLYDEAQRHRHRLETLNDVSRHLAAAHDSDQILSFIVEEAPKLLGVEAAGLRMLEGDELVLRARTESAGSLMSRPRLKLGESLTGRVVATGEPIAVDDLAEDKRFDPVHKRAALEHGFHGFLGVPLRAHGRAIGTLAVYARNRRRFMPDEISLLCAFADQASLAIEKGRLLREAEERRQVLESLHRVSIAMQASWESKDRLEAFVRGAHEVLGFDRVNVFLVTSGGASLELVQGHGETAAPPLSLPLSPGAGPYYQAIETRRPVAVLAEEDRAKALPMDSAYLDHPYLRTSRFVIAPLVVGERIIGAVSADNKSSRRPIDPGSIEPFSLLGQQLAAALEESRLYSEAQAREREATKLYNGVALLNQASRKLHRTLEVETMLKSGLDALAATFEADSAMVNLVTQEGEVTRRIGHWISGAHGRDVTVQKGGITRLVWRNRTPLVLADIEEHRDLVHPTHFAHGVKSLAAFPIIGREQRVLGVLFLYYTTPQLFPASDVRLLTAYAAQLGTALENAQLYEETRTQERRLNQILDSTSDGIVLVSRTGRIEAANRRAGDLLGFDPAEVVGVELAELMAGYRGSISDYERSFGALRTLLDDPDRAIEGDLDLRTFKRIVHWVAQPTHDASGATIGFTLTLHDVTQEREVSQMKSDFVSFVTHQLRTPLAGIKWMLELAAQSSDLPEEPRSYVEDARSAAERLVGLVNDLLNVSRLERGKLTVTPQPTDLRELTRSVLDELSVLVRDKGHRLSVGEIEAVPPLMVDPQLLRQVILNLVSNAIKYTPAGGDIAVRMSRQDRQVLWAIQDSGIGISKQAQERLFEKFYRAENVVTIETEGTGLGLYLVRLIMEQLGGRVWCESEEGEGSTFLFTLPIAE